MHCLYLLLLAVTGILHCHRSVWLFQIVVGRQQTVDFSEVAYIYVTFWGL